MHFVPCLSCFELCLLQLCFDVMSNKWIDWLTDVIVSLVVIVVVVVAAAAVVILCCTRKFTALAVSDVYFLVILSNNMISIIDICCLAMSEATQHSAHLLPFSMLHTDCQPEQEPGLLDIQQFFIARRSYDSAVLGVLILSVCLSVRLSHACFVTKQCTADILIPH